MNQKKKKKCMDQNKKACYTTPSLSPPLRSRHQHHSLGVRQHPKVAADILLSLDQLLLGATVRVEAAKRALAGGGNRCGGFNLLGVILNHNLQALTRINLRKMRALNK